MSEVGKVQQETRVQIAAGWEAKGDAALGRGDMVAFREACVNRWAAQTLATAKREGWGSWKTRAVCKYVAKVVQNMTLVELSILNDQAARELVEHAASGFDDFARRRASR